MMSCLSVYHLVTQVFVAQTSYDLRRGYYLTVWEADGNIQVCLQTNGIVTEPLHVHLQTIEAAYTGYKATGTYIIGNRRRKEHCIITIITCVTPPTSTLLRGYACYYCCMPSSPVLLHMCLVWGYACCMPSSPVLLYIYCPCFSTFWYCHPYIIQHFNGNVFTLCI